jgi:hypothetical protein
MVNLADMAGSWRAFLRRTEASAPQRAPVRREPVPAVPFEPRIVARIRLVRRVVAVPASDEP